MTKTKPGRWLYAMEVTLRSGVTITAEVSRDDYVGVYNGHTLEEDTKTGHTTIGFETRTAKNPPVFALAMRWHFPHAWMRRFDYINPEEVAAVVMTRRRETVPARSRLRHHLLCDRCKGYLQREADTPPFGYGATGELICMDEECTEVLNHVAGWECETCDPNGRTR